MNIQQQLSSQEYIDLMNFVFDELYEEWFTKEFGDDKEWFKNEDNRKKVEDMANAKKEKWMTLRKKPVEKEK